MKPPAEQRTKLSCQQKVAAELLALMEAKLLVAVPSRHGCSSSWSNFLSVADATSDVSPVRLPNRLAKMFVTFRLPGATVASNLPGTSDNDVGEPNGVAFVQNSGVSPFSWL